MYTNIYYILYLDAFYSCSWCNLPPDIYPPPHMCCGTHFEIKRIVMRKVLRISQIFNRNCHVSCHNIPCNSFKYVWCLAVSLSRISFRNSSARLSSNNSQIFLYNTPPNLLNPAVGEWVLRALQISLGLHAVHSSGIEQRPAQ